MENSHISWCDHSWNPWMGCQRVSPGCMLCYAETLMDTRYHKVKWGPTGTRVRTSEAYWKKPITWNKDKWLECQACYWRGSVRSVKLDQNGAFICPHCASEEMQPVRQRVFCASLSDWLEDRPELIPWRGDLLTLISQTPNLDWMLLTKRIEGWNDRLREVVQNCPGDGGTLASRWLDGIAPHNIWSGVSIENQDYAWRAQKLCCIPSVIRFVSVEPMLGPVDLEDIVTETEGFEIVTNVLNGITMIDGQGYLPGRHIHSVIVGGESGPDCRPFNPDWARGLRDACAATGVGFHMKQLGGHPNKFDKLEDLPEDLRIRQNAAVTFDPKGYVIVRTGAEHDHI